MEETVNKQWPHLFRKKVRWCVGDEEGLKTQGGGRRTPTASTKKTEHVTTMDVQVN